MTRNYRSAGAARRRGLYCRRHGISSPRQLRPGRVGRRARYQQPRHEARHGRQPRGRARRARRGHHALRHRRLLRRVRGPARRAARGQPRRRRAGDQVRRRRAQPRRRQRRGLGRARVAALHPPGGRIVAAPAADRLDRPLPAAPPGRGHADRGDAGRAVRSGARGQGALHRLVQLHRLAGGRGRVDRRAPGTWSASSAPRTSTAGSTAGSRTTSSPRSSTTASGCCRSSRSPAGCSPGSTAAARPRRRAAGSRRGAASRRSPTTPST